MYREIGNRSGEADALNSLGEVLLAIGQPGHARFEYATALRLAVETRDKYQQARAHHGLGAGLPCRRRPRRGLPSLAAGPRAVH